MQWITALLAFATTMLFFAIIVSMLVEMIHRTFRMRQAGLRLMLQRYFEVVLKDTKHVDLTRGGGTEATALDFANDMVTNRAMEPSANEEESFLKDWWGSQVMRMLLDSSKHTDLPVEIFVQKLADEKFLPQADVPDEVLKDLSQRYVGFGRGMSAYFERRARLFSVIISFVVAWIFYVHPYDLAVAYLKSPELAQDVAAMSQQMIEKVKKLRPEPSAEGTRPPTARMGAPSRTAMQGTAASRVGSRRLSAWPSNLLQRGWSLRRRREPKRRRQRRLHQRPQQNRGRIPGPRMRSRSRRMMRTS